ncbi:unnamed protein product [Spirodela intermedia]|uniref:Uncharacterized protein n=1 Tax=Spirodela intermedia TaxID=51605 RepID=A0A7I8KYN9_SPIIN|nr:unnamed protein product [Spirodela intermedia]
MKQERANRACDYGRHPPPVHLLFPFGGGIGGG